MEEEVRAAYRRERLFGTSAPDIAEAVQRTQRRVDFGMETDPAGFASWAHAALSQESAATAELRRQAALMRLRLLRRLRKVNAGMLGARSNIAVSTCIELMRRLVRSGRTRTARQYLHEVIDDLLQRGQFATVDALLISADPAQDDARVLITLLTASKPGKGRLRVREDFFRRAAEAIRQRHLDEPGLLAGLE